MNILRNATSYVYNIIPSLQEDEEEENEAGPSNMSDQKTDIPSDPPPSYEASHPASKPLPKPLPPSLPVLVTLRKKRVILASASPRRKQIIAYLGLPNIEIIPSNTAEDCPKTLTPFEYVLETATQKGLAVYKQEIDNEEKGEPALILAADTIVVNPKTGDILEKPRSEAQHITPLESAQAPGYALESVVEETSVRFDPQITDELLLAYVRTREGADKAGGYGMQGLGSVLVEKINGSYDNVIGLPLRATLRLIEKVMAIAEEDAEADHGALADDD
ncbi:conserved hypothetical protein [Microsporum canis CBS 113480]|uniref:Maf-like protein n=1 Tax=Arthroderma otae (strain ATCC MYA-4605 / CBS 113480) TaxID=554155 RepID=C5FV17_ARTOC|nr:conserved hypothetical protein [Microsporum canis CBS 113480]EEQ33751.1 conserved hypothetical protein [Microsporum canis CBS 113480]